jgi:hypothetical protein
VYTTSNTGTGQIQSGGYMFANQGTVSAALQNPQSIKDKTINPNECEAWVMPLSALVNLWRSKHLDSWVNFYNAGTDSFWQEAAIRLHRADLFETTPDSWVRLKEHA